MFEGENGERAQDTDADEGDDAGDTEQKRQPEAKPPGLYYLAAIGPGCELAERATFEGRRAETQWAASEAALRLALVCLEGATSVDDEPTSSTPTSDAERERHG